MAEERWRLAGNPGDNLWTLGWHGWFVKQPCYLTTEVCGVLSENLRIEIIFSACRKYHAGFAYLLINHIQ